jgi:hypothetical protein
MPSRAAFDPVQQELRFFGSQAATRAVTARPPKRAAFQAFRTHPRTRAVEDKQFQAVARPVREDKDMARQGILAEHALHVGVEPIEALPLMLSWA